MSKQVIIGLFAVSMMAMFWTEADAGCVRVGGKRVCSENFTGSVINLVQTFGLENVINCAETEEGCPTITSTARGIGDAGLKGSIFCGSPESSGISLQSITTTHSGNEGRKVQRRDNVELPADVTLTDTEEITKCKLQLHGKCILTLSSLRLDVDEEDPDLGDFNLCPTPGFPTFITFVPRRFESEVKVCDGQIGNGEGEPHCYTEEEGFITLRETCEVSLNGIRLGEKRLYSCKRLVDSL